MTESAVYDPRDVEVREEAGMVVVEWITAIGRARLRLNPAAAAFLAADITAAAREVPQ